MKKVNQYALAIYTGLCFYFAWKLTLQIEHLAFLVVLMFFDSYDVPFLARRLPVKFWQVLFFDEKREWGFSYTRTVTSVLLSCAIVIIIKGVVLWSMPPEIVYILGSIFTLVAALLGIKRSIEAYSQDSKSQV